MLEMIDSEFYPQLFIELKKWSNIQRIKAEPGASVLAKENANIAPTVQETGETEKEGKGEEWDEIKNPIKGLDLKVRINKLSD